MKHLIEQTTLSQLNIGDLVYLNKWHAENPDIDGILYLYKGTCIGNLTNKEYYVLEDTRGRNLLDISKECNASLDVWRINLREIKKEEQKLK